MKKNTAAHRRAKTLLLIAVALGILWVSSAHAMYIDTKHGRCYLSDKTLVPCSDLYGKEWRKIFKEWNKQAPETKGARPPFPEEYK
jgi:hypothetical protein